MHGGDNSKLEVCRVYDTRHTLTGERQNDAREPFT